MKKNSFTLVEVIVSVVIMGVAAASLAGIFLAGRYFIKQTENKAFALSIATLELDRAVIKAYSDLAADIEDGNDSYSDTTSRPSDSKPFDYVVAMDKRYINNATSGAQIPYINIEVSVEYWEDLITGNTLQKAVTLSGIVPYPYTHIEKDTKTLGVTPVTTTFRCVNGSCGSNNALKIEFEYETKKDLQVMYNITLDNQNLAGVDNIDLIETRCYLKKGTGGWVYYPIETGTPIISQPHITNIIAIENLQRNTPYTLAVVWRKDTSSGIIEIQEANLSIVAVEDE